MHSLKMSKIHLLRTNVKERLTTAAEQILGSVERTTLEFKQDVFSLSKKDDHKLQNAIEQRPVITLQSRGTEIQQQKVVVTEQLTAAAEEILMFVERVIAEFEEETVRSKQEIDRQRKLLDIILKPEIKLHRADTLKDEVSEENVPELDCSPSLSQEDPQNLQTRWPLRVKERLTAAAENILLSVERTTLEFKQEFFSLSKKDDLKLQDAIKQRPVITLQSCGTEIQQQRVVVTEQLTAAAEEILVVVERVIAEFEEEAVRSKQEIDRQRKLLDIILKPEIKLHRADTLQDKVSVCGEENLPELDLSPCLSHEDPQPLQSEEEICTRDLQPLSSDCAVTDSEEDNSEDLCNNERENGGSDDDWREGGHQLSLKTQKTKMKAEKPSTQSDKTEKSSKLKCQKSRAKVVSTPFCCKVCGQPFCYEGTLWKHVQKHDSGTDICGVCGKGFDSEESLKLHLKMYIRTNVCSVCGKQFDRHKELVIHMRTHTKEKPYLCSYCNKGFSRMDSMKAHMRLHTGKPFCCSDCGETFTRNAGLKTHMRVHSGERPHVCTVCGKAFMLRRNLVVHMRIHTGEKPYVCSVCGKSFSQSSTLKMHTRIHTGERTHICDFCGKGFYKGGALKVHLRTHTGEKPYLCNERTHCCTVCGTSFTRKDNLKNHTKIHTGDM